MPGAWQGSHWSASFEVTGMTRPPKKSRRKRDSNPESSTLEADALTTRPTRRSGNSGKGSIQVHVCHDTRGELLLLVGCLTSQQHATVSQGRICTDNFTCCHTEMEAADPTFHLTQSQYTDTWPTSPSTDPITPGAWQGSHWSANF